MKSILFVAAALELFGQPQAAIPWSTKGEQNSAQSWSCSPRLKCSQISSCDEAMWYLENCPWGGKLDRDKDGIPCESLC